MEGFTAFQLEQTIVWKSKDLTFVLGLTKENTLSLTKLKERH